MEMDTTGPPPDDEVESDDFPPILPGTQQEQIQITGEHPHIGHGAARHTPEPAHDNREQHGSATAVTVEDSVNGSLSIRTYTDRTVVSTQPPLHNTNIGNANAAQQDTTVGDAHTGTTATGRSDNSNADIVRNPPRHPSPPNQTSPASPPPPENETEQPIEVIIIDDDSHSE